MHNGKIWITDWRNNRHEMSPNELLNRIKSDSETNWNWFAPASEIVKAISDPKFPEPIANELKGIVLKCFAELLLSDIGSTRKSTDQLAVAYCYYSIHGKSGKQIKRLYRENLLKSVIKYSFWVKPVGADGEEWHTFYDDWKKDALRHFTKRFGVDFMRFRANIEADYTKSVQRADKAGKFENDKIKYEELMKTIITSVWD